MGLLDGQTALVTGGGSGIGAATGRRLVAEGARVALLDSRLGEVEKVAEEIGGLVVQADVAERAAMEDAVDRVWTEFGGLTILFNNAGTGAIEHLDRYEDDVFDRLVAVNLKGVFNGIRAVAPMMRDAGRGSIVNMASVSGIRPTRGEAPYSAAKAGVIALTKSAALEYAPSVRVNCVSPGVIATPLTEVAIADDDLRRSVEAGTPLGRVGTAHEVAGVVVFLCSDLASYVTGENVLIDGGSTLPNGQVDGMLAAMLEMFSQPPAE